MIFVFVTMSAVYPFFPEIGTGLDGYINAFCFMITTLTITGYSSILPKSNFAKITAVAIMVVVVTVFVNLARASLRPKQVQYECKSCGLNLHDPDAVDCKHCGAIVHIETSGIP